MDHRTLETAAAVEQSATQPRETTPSRLENGLIQKLLD